MQIVVGTTNIASFPTRHVSLVATLGGFELVLSFIGSINPSEVQRRFVLFSANVTVIAGGSSAYLGRAAPKAPVTIVQHNGPHTAHCQFSVSLPLSNNQIQAIEKLRAGHDVTFNVTLQGLAYAPPQLMDANTQADQMVAVSQSDWVKSLTTANAGSIVLLEINLSRLRDGGLAHPGVRHFENAYQAFLSGDYTKTVGECRKVAESMEGSRLGKIKGDFSSKSGNFSKAERTTMLLVAIHTYCHSAMHAGENTEPVDYSYEDAKLILTMTASYINWTADQARG